MDNGVGQGNQNIYQQEREIPFHPVHLSVSTPVWLRARVRAAQFVRAPAYAAAELPRSPSTRQGCRQRW
jgi:hypothetical protein